MPRKFKKTFKKFRKKYHLDLFATLIIPCSVLIGILGQISILSQYNAVVAFSWNQVFSDSAILIPLIFSAIVGYLSHILFDSLKLEGKEKLKGTIFLFSFICIFVIVLGIIRYLNIYLIGLSSFFFFGYVTKFSVLGGKKEEGGIDKWKFTFPTLIFTVILAVFITIGSFFHIGYGYIYKQVFIKDGDKTYQVNYMNDNIIIYNDGMITDSDNEEIDIIIYTSLENIVRIQ